MEAVLTTVDADGAITIPADMLRDLGISEGDDVTIEPFAGGLRLCRQERSSDPRD